MDTITEEDQKQINDIADQISIIINRAVSKKVPNRDSKWEEHYNDCMERLSQEMHIVEKVIADYAEENLTVNRIEQEGYLRALKTMLNEFKDNEQYIYKWVK